MTKKIRLSLERDPYDIVIGAGILPELGGCLAGMKAGTDAVVITNPAIRRRYGAVVSCSLEKAGFAVKFLLVPDGEESKKAEVAVSLVEKIAAYDVMKKVFVVALGGGVIGDLAGFVAATYRRGVPYVQVPTTLLAQIDSAIGGKTAVDLKAGKNLMGAFHQPMVVWSDISVLKTLPARQIRNGMAEAVKYGMITDAGLFRYIERNVGDILAGELCALQHIVEVSSRIKADVVTRDEKETKKIRTILNFGHTVGHAIEAAGKYGLYQHGEAIALGMRIAARISVKLDLLPVADEERLGALLTRLKLPARLEKVRLKDVLSIMCHDKKFIAGSNRFVLAEAIGKVKVVDGVPEQIIAEAIAELTA